MALGTITSVKRAGQKTSTPCYVDLVTVVGDGAYASGGTAGFLALFRAAIGDQREIVGVVDQSQPDTLSALEYDFTNDKLFARVRTTGVESAVANQSAVTYRLLVISR
jgi:hypothetical protein